MKKIYEKLKKQHKMVSFYCDWHDTEECFTGYIEDVSKNYILISKVTPYGIADGYILKAICDVAHIETEGEYQKKIETLSRMRKQKHPALKYAKKPGLKKAVLNACEDKHFVVSINVTEDDEDYPVIGFIELEDNVVKVKELDQYGTYICDSYIHTRLIYSVEIEGLYEQSRHMLYDYRQNQAE